jgi:hypothetical protein
MFDESPGVLAAVPVGFAVKLRQFPHEIEFEEGSWYRRRVRPPLLVVVVRCVCIVHFPFISGRSLDDRFPSGTPSGRFQSRFQGAGLG